MPSCLLQLCCSSLGTGGPTGYWLGSRTWRGHQSWNPERWAVSGGGDCGQGIAVSVRPLGPEVVGKAGRSVEPGEQGLAQREPVPQTPQGMVLDVKLLSKRHRDLLESG